MSPATPKPVPSDPQSRTFVSENLKLHYLDWGNESAPLLVLVHGMWDHAFSWKWVAENFRKEYHVVAMDLRGHGDSAWSPDGAYLPSYLLLDFVAFIDSLGHESFDVIAHSYGGNATARYAAIYPDRIRKLVLVDAMGPGENILNHWKSQSAIVRLRDWIERRQQLGTAGKTFESIEEGCEKLKKANSLLTDEQALFLVEKGSIQCGENAYRWKYDPLVGNFTLDDYSVHLSEYWRGIRCPTLLCWGPKSWTANPAEDGASDLFEKVECRTFKDSGHWIHHSQLDDFVAAAGKFLSK